MNIVRNHSEIIREMWLSGVITDDLYKSGKIPFDLLIMWTHNIELQMEEGHTYYTILSERCDNYTIVGQIKANENYINLIKKQCGGNIPDKYSLLYDDYDKCISTLATLRNLHELSLISRN